MAGSDKRQRSRMVSIRLAPAEAERLTADAARAGLSLGGYARQVLLNAPPPRQSRRPAVERELLAQCLRQLGKLGSNVNQLARAANSGLVPARAELLAACGAVLELRAALLRALGVSEPESPPPPPESGDPRP